MWRPKISAARPSRLGPAVLAHDGFTDPAGGRGRLYRRLRPCPHLRHTQAPGRRDPVAWRSCAAPGHDLVRRGRWPRPAAGRMALVVGRRRTIDGWERATPRRHQGTRLLFVCRFRCRYRGCDGPWPLSQRLSTPSRRSGAGPGCPRWLTRPCRIGGYGVPARYWLRCGGVGCARDSLGRTCAVGVTGALAADSPPRHAAGPAGGSDRHRRSGRLGCLEACREPAADFVFPRKAPPPGTGPARRGVRR